MKQSGYFPLFLWLVLLISSCSVSKFIPEGEYLLDDVKILSDNRNLKPITVSSYVKQYPNSRWFSSVKTPLYIYAASGLDTTKWNNRTLRKLGQAPVLYSRHLTERSEEDLTRAVQNMGYMDASVLVGRTYKKNRITLHYLIHTGDIYTVRSFGLDIQDARIDSLLQHYSWRIADGVPFSINELNNERNRITTFLQSCGYYKFNKDFITFTADTTLGNHLVDLTLHLQPYKTLKYEGQHPIYTVREVNVVANEVGSHTLHEYNVDTLRSTQCQGLNIYYTQAPFLRPKVLSHNIDIQPHMPFNEEQLQTTHHALGKIRAIKFADVRFVEHTDTVLGADGELDCHIVLARAKQHSVSAELEGTNTAGDLGAATSLTYQNKNIFKGGEVFTFKVRGSYEAVTGLKGYSDDFYTEYGAEASLNFPRFLFPFLTPDFKKKMKATSEISVQMNSQVRPEFTRRVASATWSYKWNQGKRNHYKVDLLDLNYVYMPRISSTFKETYLDSISTRNAFLKYYYDNLFIMKTGYTYSYRTAESLTPIGNSYSIRLNVEWAGNTLYALSHLCNATKNEDGHYTMGGIAYAQYVKGDVDYAKGFRLTAESSLVFHLGFGIAYPYGNATMLPFEKRYFSGGANSVRGWAVRTLGPGKYEESDKNINFLNQSGDLKIDLNLEYRAQIFWKICGALFIDAGNNWTIRSYNDQPGGEFKPNTFFKQIAMAYGAGLRLDLDFFILRLDGGMKALNPVYDSGPNRYPLLHPRWGRDFAFHFAVGYPF